MRLSNFIPTIPADLVACLEAEGIRTDTDLLFSTTIFDLYKRLPAGMVTLEELEEYLDLVTELGAAPGVSGHELFLVENGDHSIPLQTGNTEVDEIFRGLDGRWMIELSGARSSGKSTVALNLILHYLSLHPGDTGAWIDTTCDFSPERAARVLRAQGNELNTLDRLQVSVAFDIDAIQGILDDLVQSGGPQSRLRFLVIDAITPILGPLLSAVSAQGHAIMTDFMRQLQSFAQSSGTAVIVINNSARKGADTQDRKPALGPSFALMTDTTLWLEARAGSDPKDHIIHSIQVLRSRSAPIGRNCTFRIENNVICSVMTRCPDSL